MAEPLEVVDEEKAILIALCVRHQRNWEQREADRQLKAEVEKRIADSDAAFVKLEAAIKAFGADPTTPGWFAPIRDACGRAEFDKAMEAAGYYFFWEDNFSQAAPVSETEQAIPTEALPSTASVRELVLERLKWAGITGTQASAIRKSIEDLRQTTLHEKTIGMTLYRLSLDGLARREGRIWFFVPEAKNPGAATPGPINREDKEGEEL